MNLHQLNRNPLLDYMHRRYPTYIFELRDGTVWFTYFGTFGTEEWQRINPNEQSDYQRHAIEWEAQGRP